MKKDIENSQAESFRFYECKGVDVALTPLKPSRLKGLLLKTICLNKIAKCLFVAAKL